MMSSIWKCLVGSQSSTWERTRAGRRRRDRGKNARGEVGRIARNGAGVICAAVSNYWLFLFTVV